MTNEDLDTATEMIARYRRLAASDPYARHDSRSVAINNLAAELERCVARLRAGAAPSDGGLLLSLFNILVKRIMDADANCDPPEDVELRLASIIRERDELKAGAAPDRQSREAEFERLRRTETPPTQAREVTARWWFERGVEFAGRGAAPEVEPQ